MKNYFALLLAVLLMFCCGCARQNPAQPGTTPAETQGTQPVEPGTYLAGSQTEQRTDGAIRVFDPETEDFRGFRMLHDGVLIFSGEEKTTLTAYRGDNLTKLESRSFDYLIRPEDLAIEAESGEMAFYDEQTQELVILDPALEDSRRVMLPSKAMGEVAVVPDWKTVYYAAADGLYAMDLSTGLSRMLKEQKNDDQTRLQLCFHGLLLSCTRTMENGQVQTQYLSPEDGSTVFVSNELELFATNADSYFFPKQEGSLLRYGCGQMEGEPSQLVLPEDALVLPVVNAGGVLSVRSAGQSRTAELIELKTGMKTAAVSLEPEEQILAADGSDGAVLLAMQVQEKTLLYQWNPAKSQLDQPISCMEPYESRAQINTRRLTELKEQAVALGEEFGMEIRIATEVMPVCPEGYAFEMEYLTHAYQRDLRQLEESFRKFPEDFFRKAAEGSRSGVLTVSLVREIQKNDQTVENRETGLQYWIDENAYMALTMGSNLERNFYHALSHLIDNRVLGNSLAYDDWEKLNPAGFAYDYDYKRNETREGGAYLEGENRAFIDTYSMSYPKEDRARILEFAMLPQGEPYFQSAILQEKLRRLCLGIREGFELPPEGTYLWEQYLAQPLFAEEE